MTSPAPPIAVRRRRLEDVPLAAAVLERQQSTSGYPYRDPLPFPMTDFVDRPRQLAAWVATVDDASGEQVVGHVGVSSVDEASVGAAAWCAAMGRPVDALGEVGALVVDLDLRGRGVGRLLMDAVEEHLHEAGLTPVLAVLPVNAAAHALYLARGWQEVGIARFDWVVDEMPDARLLVLP